jgi:succinate dehydrogenase/fumarate reductase flavoprotein subunit
MAEGGIAAAMANVDKADSWRTHFRDTMRGGKLTNNPRMAQLLTLRKLPIGYANNMGRAL